MDDLETQQETESQNTSLSESNTEESETLAVLIEDVDPIEEKENITSDFDEDASTESTESNSMMDYIAKVLVGTIVFTAVIFGIIYFARGRMDN